MLLPGGGAGPAPADFADVAADQFAVQVQQLSDLAARVALDVQSLDFGAALQGGSGGIFLGDDFVHFPRGIRGVWSQEPTRTDPGRLQEGENSIQDRSRN